MPLSLQHIEVPVVHEVVRRIPRITVHEIPIERVIQVPKKVVQEIEQPIYRPVPHLVHCEVEHEVPVPLVQTQTVEMVNASYEDNTEPQVEIHKIVEKETQVQWHGNVVFHPCGGYTPFVTRSWRSQ